MGGRPEDATRGFNTGLAQAGGMYAVVGCNSCGNVWLLSDPDDADSAQCSRCGKRHRTRKLRHLYRSDDREAAREVRAAILAEKRGEKASFDRLDSVAEMERRLDAAGIDDDDYLAGAGLDPDEVAAAGDRAAGNGRGESRGRSEIVRDAVREGDRPDEETVVSYATEHGVPAEAARDLLERLVRRGEVSEHHGRYRLL
jgi:hypothetical protein